MFIDRVLFQERHSPPGSLDRDDEAAGLANQSPMPDNEGCQGPHTSGADAYNLLRLATETFLLFRCGVAIRPPYDPAWDEARIAQSFHPDEARQMLQGYLRDPGPILPYLDEVLAALESTDRQRLHRDRDDVQPPVCTVPLVQRITSPCLIELIWSYWHEQGMLVETMNAVSMRFESERSNSGARDPLAHLEIDPLRPVNNLIWGYIQDEFNRLSIPRRSNEYDHRYGLSLAGRAERQTATVDSRSKFLEAFHDLLFRTRLFYDEDADGTVESNTLQLLSGLREVQLLLAGSAPTSSATWPGRRASR